MWLRFYIWQMERVIWDGETCRYRVHVYTGSRLGASTKAEVNVALCGYNGRTEDIWLQDSLNHKIKFQKGQVGFEISCSYQTLSTQIFHKWGQCIFPN